MASHGVPRVSGTASTDKSAAAREKEQRQITEYKALENNVTDRIKSKDFSNDTFQATSRLLQQNPEYHTVWNYRRILLQDVFRRELASGNSAVINVQANEGQDGDALAASKAGLTLAQQEISLLLSEDLAFLIPLLKQYPKCYWIWNHRAWLLAKATELLPVQTASQMWRGELALVSKMLALDSRNFHAWSYRRSTVQQIEQLELKSLAEDEFAYTTKMVNTNLSNFSAWHNRGQLLPRLLHERQATDQARKGMFDAEMELITRALYTDPYDQSLWFYHQYLMSTLDAASSLVIDTHTRHTNIIALPISDATRMSYLEQELASIEDMLDGAEDCKYVYQALLEYSQRLDHLAGGSRVNVSTSKMGDWLDQVRKLDPLREGRWTDLATSLKL
ncbi:Rab geranylgeranyltransferase [Oleoguttula sp. CCFEE 5521]